MGRVLRTIVSDGSRCLKRQLIMRPMKRFWQRCIPGAYSYRGLLSDDESLLASYIPTGHFGASRRSGRQDVMIRASRRLQSAILPLFTVSEPENSMGA
jgi:hypothetical protein